MTTLCQGHAIDITDRCWADSAGHHFYLHINSLVHVNIHCNEVIMSVMSVITSLTIVHSTLYSWRKSKKTSKLCVTGFCEGKSPGTGEFRSQRASNAENVPFDDVMMFTEARTLQVTGRDDIDYMRWSHSYYFCWCSWNFVSLKCRENYVKCKYFRWFRYLLFYKIIQQ